MGILPESPKPSRRAEQFERQEESDSAPSCDKVSIMPTQPSREDELALLRWEDEGGSCTEFTYQPAVKTAEKAEAKTKTKRE